MSFLAPGIQQYVELQFVLWLFFLSVVISKLPSHVMLICANAVAKLNTSHILLQNNEVKKTERRQATLKVQCLLICLLDFGFFNFLHVLSRSYKCFASSHFHRVAFDRLAFYLSEREFCIILKGSVTVMAPGLLVFIVLRDCFENPCCQPSKARILTRHSCGSHLVDSIKSKNPNKTFKEVILR